VAGFGAEPAVVVVGGVPLALLATDAAGRRAGFDSCAEEFEIGCGLAGEDAAGSVTDVGAVEVETNAADQLLHVFLAETGVGTARARSGTVKTLVDAAQQHLAIKAGRLGMRLDDFSSCHVLSLLVRATLGVRARSIRSRSRAPLRSSQRPVIAGRADMSNRSAITTEP
jgi:hypothetical protein